MWNRQNQITESPTLTIPVRLSSKHKRNWYSITHPIKITRKLLNRKVTQALLALHVDDFVPYDTICVHTYFLGNQSHSQARFFMLNNFCCNTTIL